MTSFRLSTETETAGFSTNLHHLLNKQTPFFLGVESKPSSPQGSLLTLYSGVIVGGLYRMPGSEPGSDTCKAKTLPTISIR